MNELKSYILVQIKLDTSTSIFRNPFHDVTVDGDG